MMFVPPVYLDVAIQVDGKVWGCASCQVTWIAVDEAVCWSCRQPTGKNLLWVNVPQEILPLSR